MAIYNDTTGKCGLKAASAITAKHLIEISTFPEVQHTSAQTSMPCGVATANAATGEAVSYDLPGGFTTLVASGTINVSAEICADSAGRIAAGATTDFIIGFACEASVSDGDEIRVFLFRGGWVHV